MKAHGIVLLEIMLSLVLFVTSGIAILGAVDQGTRGLGRVRDQQKAADLARSAMARLEAGLANPIDLAGPVPIWTDGEDGLEDLSGDAGGTFPGDAGFMVGWEMEIETEPTRFDGLTSVRIRAVRRSPTRPDVELASYALRQLVRLGNDTESIDEIGEEDELTMEAERGLRGRGSSEEGGGR
jgi:hypothetical protein